MPQVFNIRHLPGFKERHPVIPLGVRLRWPRDPVVSDAEEQVGEPIHD
jgi:hypothetical protein